MRSKAEFELVCQLLAGGASDTEITRATGIPRPTVSSWRWRDSRRKGRPRRRREAFPADWSPPSWPAYAYLLGIYLGDGCIGATGATCRQLVLALDATYDDIVQECVAAVEAVLPGTRVTHYLRRNCPAAAVVQACHSWWPEIFPQHGPGKKHQRPIVLAEWQRKIVDRYPRRFLRGLIHSDGSRVINRFKTELSSGRVAEYAYARYFFTNLSEDILGLFSEYCERVGARWTRSNAKNISVADGRSVAILDSFIGPKQRACWRDHEWAGVPERMDIP